MLLAAVMGHRHSRERGETQAGQHLRNRGVADHAAPRPHEVAPVPVPAPPPEPVKPKYPFRCEDRSKIPDDIVEGPFEEFEIVTDVYSTAYLIARNSGDMYSIWPWKNRDVLLVWVFLLFISGSQLFVILSVMFWYPPSVSTSSLLVICGNSTMVKDAFRKGFLSSPSKASCLEAGTFAFEADLRGVPRHYYTLEKSIPYYDSILKEGDPCIYFLRLICCVWVFSQVYLQEFSNVRSLLLYHDFSLWFLPIKGEPTRNGWAICLPIIQYFVVLIVCTVSFVIICAQAEAFDIVMNSLAFTFIAEVGSYFNGPLSDRMGSTLIKGLNPEDYPDPIFYLYPQYDISNAVYDDDKYTDGGWYIVEDEQKAGLLSDYRIRHNPAKYTKFFNERIGLWLERALFIVPLVVVMLGAIRCHYCLNSPGQTRSEL